MPIFGKLVSLYERHGIAISSGLAPWRHANLPQVNATWFLRGGRNLTNGLGISSQEIYFFECLFAEFHPASIFIIGNSWGWSTLALSLLNPQARVVAIDGAFEDGMMEGLDLTNRIAAEEGLNLKAIRAVSPQDVAGVVAAEFTAPLDCVFIDGMHTNAQVQIDARAVRPRAAADAVFVFHDVLEWGLGEGVNHIASEMGRALQVLDGTTSGIGVMFDPARRPEVARAIAPFHASEQAKAAIAAEVYRVTRRHRLRIQRSVRKRVQPLLRLLGGHTPPRD